MQESVNVGALRLCDHSAITGSQAFRISLIRITRANLITFKDHIRMVNYVYQSDGIPSRGVYDLCDAVAGVECECVNGASA